MAGQKRVHHSDAAIQPIVLKILGKNYREAVVFCIGPEVRVKPVQLICCTSTDGVAQYGLIWIENGELFQQFLRFPKSIGLVEDNVAANGGALRRRQTRQWLDVAGALSLRRCRA